MVEQKQIVIIQKGMEQNTMDVCVSIRIPALMSGIKVAAEHNIWMSCNKVVKDQRFKWFTTTLRAIEIGQSENKICG